MAKRNTTKQYVVALYEITKGKHAADLSRVLKEFVALIVRDRKLKQIDKIIVEFEKYTKQQKGIVELEITSARKLDDTTIAAVKKVFGEKTEAITNTDESLIGGVRVKMEDRILDGSIITQLRALKSQLNSK